MAPTPRAVVISITRCPGAVHTAATAAARASTGIQMPRMSSSRIAFCALSSFPVWNRVTERSTCGMAEARLKPASTRRLRTWSITTPMSSWTVSPLARSAPCPSPVSMPTTEACARRLPATQACSKTSLVTTRWMVRCTTVRRAERSGPVIASDASTTRGGAPLSASTLVSEAVSALTSTWPTTRSVSRFTRAFWTAGSDARGATVCTYRSVSATVS